MDLGRGGVKNQTLKFGMAVLAVAVGLSSAQAAVKPVGTMHVTVVDENGAVVENAPVYIYGEHKTKFVGGKEIDGSSTLTMPAGNYRVSTALIRHSGEYLDRYASHEAHIQVVEGDKTSVILTLRPLQDPTAAISFAELNKIGVPSSIVRNLN
jgi:hypothetical protein